MATRLGSLAVAALRVEGGAVSGTNIVSSAYPTTTATSANERMTMKWGEGLPLLSESMNSTITNVDSETLDGKGGVTKSDTTSIMSAGGIEVQGTYDGIGAILALATGYEKCRTSASNTANYMPDILDATALTSSAAPAIGAWDDTGTPLLATDVGKFIRINTAGNTFGMVRRIDTFTDTNTVGVEPDWNSIPVSGDVAKMGYFFNHKYVTVPAMQDELITNVNSYWDGDGLDYATTNKLIKRGTLSVYKGDSATVETWTGCKVDSLDISCSAGELMTISVGFTAFNGVRASAGGFESEWGDRKYANTDALSYSKTNHGSALNEPIGFSDLSFCRVGAFNGSGDLSASDNQSVSSMNLSLTNGLDATTQTASSGLYNIEPARSGVKEVSGSFTIPRYESAQWIDWRDNQTDLMAHLSFLGSLNIASTHDHNFEIRVPKIRVTGVSAPVGGAGIVTQDITWKAIMPNHATPFGLTTYQDWNTTTPDIPMPELWFSLNNFDPWHAYLDQNREY